MKKILIVIASVLIFIINIRAQVSLTIEEETRSMSKGAHNAFVMQVPQTKVDDLRKSWGSFLKKHGKIKPEEYKGEYFTLASVVNRISHDPVDHYVLFSDNPSGAVMTTFFVLKDSFISTANNPAIAGNISKFMYDFGKETYIAAVESELEVEQKKLKDLEKDLEDLHKEEDKEAKNVTESQNKIKNNENEELAKKNEQELKQKEIMMHKENNLGANLSPDEKKVFDGKIKDMESEKQKLIKIQDGLRKDNMNLESGIKKSERNISNLKGQQELKEKEITMQREIVQKVETKLGEVKKL